MKQAIFKLTATFAIGLAAAVSSQAAFAQDLTFAGMGKGGTKGGPNAPAPEEEPPASYTPQAWMASDISVAWDDGFYGQGTTITVVDDFSSQWGYYGDFGDGEQLHRHGEWTYIQASMIAPQATMNSQDFARGGSVRLAKNRLNILNLSYGMMGASGYDVNNLLWSAREQSIITYAQNGDAVISKAAGNDAVAVGATTADDTQDYLAQALVGTQSALFVGALDHNGSTEAKASLAYYSNFAGSNPTIQDQFLVVGVEGGITGLYGTSFAAPIVAGYASILGSKFTSASPTSIKQQLLDTARTDTIQGYSEAIHGQGEASISRAIAPTSIN